MRVKGTGRRMRVEGRRRWTADGLLGDEILDQRRSCRLLERAHSEVSGQRFLSIGPQAALGPGPLLSSPMVLSIGGESAVATVSAAAALALATAGSWSSSWPASAAFGASSSSSSPPWPAASLKGCQAAGRAHPPPPGSPAAVMTGAALAAAARQPPALHPAPPCSGNGPSATLRRTVRNTSRAAPRAWESSGRRKRQKHRQAGARRAGGARGEQRRRRSSGPGRTSRPPSAASAHPTTHIASAHCYWNGCGGRCTTRAQERTWSRSHRQCRCHSAAACPCAASHSLLSACTAASPSCRLCTRAAARSTSSDCSRTGFVPPARASAEAARGQAGGDVCSCCL